MVKSKKSKNTVQVNWEEEEGMKFLRDPGEYIVKVTNAEVDEDDEGKQFINWTFTVAEGKKKNSNITTKTFITSKALWKLRELLECLHVDIADSVQDIDLDEIIEEGHLFAIEVAEGKERADGNGYYMQVLDYMDLEDYKKASKEPEVDNDDDEEEPVKEVKKSKKSKKVEEPEDEEDDEEELLEEMEKEIDELGLDIDLDDYDTFEEKKEAFEEEKKKALKKSKKSKKVEEEPEDEDEEPQQTYTLDEIESFGTKQLKVIAEEIGLELDEGASTRSKRRSITQALRKAGLLEE